MKSLKGFKATGHAPEADDVIRKPAKLDPIRKSGKDRHHFSKFDDEDDELEEEYTARKKESVLDYFDDGEEE